MPTLVLEVPDQDLRWLDEIVAAQGAYPPAKDVPGLVLHLIRSAADGARRPGSWERPWLRSAVPLAREPGVPDPEMPTLYRALPAKET